MSLPFFRTRAPVRRDAAERYLLLSLVSFAASVILTRTFLELTGYPQLGNSTLHIAHVLWGGLLLFIASLLPLILANRWALNTSAILSGVGVGLFIDEVGKFITQNNDYFFPAAAPIIYAFFLLTVLVYVHVKRPRESTPRTELYSILEGLTEVLDRDLDAQERRALEMRLERIKDQTHDPNLFRLTQALIDFLEEEKLHLVKPQKTVLQKIKGYSSPFITTYVITRRRLKWYLVIALGVMGVLALIEFMGLILAIPAPEPALENFLAPLISQGELRSPHDAPWFIIRTILQGGTGILLILAGGMFTIGRERQAVELATLILIIWLTVINLLVFYLDQFGAIATTLVQFMVLTGVTYYRRKFLKV